MAESTDPSFSFPFMYWVGMNPDPATEPAALQELNDFYGHIHMGEVVASNPGFARGTRYELLGPDPRGDFGPRWLAMYDLRDEAAALTYAARDAGPPEGRPTYSAWPAARQAAQLMWRMIWQRVASSGQTNQPPEAVYLVGMNVPPDTTAADLADFNQFYTQTHVPEVMAAGGYARGTRFELYRHFLHPEPGSPRFCAIYEADAPATADHLERNAPLAGRLSSGPPAWEQHDTLWRLLYRRV